MQIKVSKKAKSQVKVVFLDKKGLKSTKDKTLQTAGFEAKKNQMVISGTTLYVGTDGIKDVEDWRVLGVKVTQKLTSMKVKTATIDVPKKCGEFVEGLQLGSYTFDKYKSKPEKSKLQTITLTSKDNIKQTVTKAVCVAKATCHTRDLVNETPENCNSLTLEKDVKKMFKGTDVKVTIYNESALEKMGAQAILHVNRASKYPAKIIKLSYEPKSFKKHHVFVLKTITFDSGGVSLKPGIHMKNMKTDMAGGAVGIGVMKYISEMGSKSKVTMYLTIAENMVSGDSYRVDDIITEMNGKTIHVYNTDAEGRLVMASGLGLAQKENKDIDTLYTIATLTGAAPFMLGAEVAGLVSFNEKLKKTIIKSGNEEGELFASVPFHKYMLDGVDDDIADVSNTGSPTQGMQKAGLFLTKFVKEKNKNKFIHLDIAGPSRADKDWGSNFKGATGFGVRTVLNLVG